MTLTRALVFGANEFTIHYFPPLRYERERGSSFGNILLPSFVIIFNAFMLVIIALIIHKVCYTASMDRVDNKLYEWLSDYTDFVSVPYIAEKAVHS